MQTVDLAPLAAALARRSSAMVDEMIDMLLEQIEELRGDEAVVGRLRASIESNASTLVHLFEQPIDIDRVDPPAGAVQWSLQLAQHGIPLSVLWRAYHLCTARFSLICIEELTQQADSVADLGRRIAAAGTLLNAYIDHVCERIGAAYEVERQRWLHQQDAVRAERIADVLAGRVGDLRQVEAGLGYRLTGRHLGLILWDVEPPDGAGLLRLQRLANVCAEQLVAVQQPLVVARDQSTVWAWLSPAGHPMPDIPATLAALLSEAGPRVRGALGDVCVGVDGFARTHRQAIVAQSVALVAGPSATRITPYAAVAGLSFLCEDLARAREWVQDILGRLATEDEAHARLRESVAAFLDAGGSLSAAAERLGCHKNTVQYRVRRAEEILGHSVRQRRVDLELALLACQWLRTAVLTAAPTA